MAYVRKLMAHDEKMIGIARLHWIYICKGLLWFAVLAGTGWFLNSVMGSLLVSIGQTLNTYAIPSMMLSMSNGLMFFFVGGGFLVFLLFVVDVLTTEIGLSNKRVMHKKGLIFVKVQQIDLEEIRGENLDLGYLGRVLGYGYLMMDCRFIGDIRLPAIEHPERFLRALHAARAQTQDALSVMVGKSGIHVPVEVIDPENQQRAQQPTPPKPDIQPGQVPTPEIQPEPTPHSPPAPSQPPSVPTQPVTPQPIPAPGPDPQPPLQPPPTNEVIPGQQPIAAQNVVLDANAVAQVVQQVLPQMAEQVARQIVQQGGLEKPAPENDNRVDNDLIADFDEARFKDADPHELHDKVEHAIH